MNAVPLSTFSILKGKIQLCQPKNGYRSGIDPIFLAAAVPLKDGEVALEVGTGIGTALLAVAQRVPQAQCVGLEMRRELVRIASQNIEANGLKGRVQVMNGDLKTPPPRLAASSFCHVFSNPPYFEEHRATKSENPLKACANVESSAPLKDWINFCARMVKPKGSVTIIFTADRLDELICCMAERLKNMEIYPLWSKAGSPAKRLIVRGWKNHGNAARLLPGLTLHEGNGEYTREARCVLENGLALDGWT